MNKKNTDNNTIERMLRLVSEEHLQLERSFILREEIGNGGVAVCYRAVCGVKTGLLKEFRSETLGSSITVYDCLESYRMLDLLRIEDSRYDIINNYIPYYEILLEISDGKKTGAYIWMPNNKPGITLETYLLSSTEKRLYDILKIAEAVSACTEVFHSLGLWNLDLKPSNILIPFLKENEPDMNHILLFDFDTLSRAAEHRAIRKVSQGYSAPELYFGKGDNRSDIYSLGAILHTALVHEDGSLKVYEDIKTAAMPVIRDKVISVIKKCTSPNPNKRFESCEEFIEEIRNIMAYCS